MTGTVTTGWKCSVCGVAATQMYQIAGRWYCWLHRPNIYPSECHNTKPVTVDDCKSIIVGVDDLQRTDREIATLRADNASLRAQVEAITSPLPGKPTEPGHYWHGDKYDEYCWHVVRVRMYGNDLAVGNSQISGWSDSDIWAGPIPEPVALEAAEKPEAKSEEE